MGHSGQVGGWLEIGELPHPLTGVQDSIVRCVGWCWARVLHKQDAMYKTAFCIYLNHQKSKSKSIFKAPLSRD